MVTVEDTPTQSMQIAAELKRRMQSGAYAPGQKLVEMDIADEFQVGRGRIREVFRTLVGEGYLEFVANRGVFVRRYTRAEMLEVGNVREVLEGLAARLAAEHALKEEDQDRLKDIQSRMNDAEAAGDTDRFNRLNRSYHDLISDFAGNQHVTEFLGRLRVPLFRLQLPLSFAVDSLARSNRDHRVITTAILMGNGDAAEAAMRAHVRAGNAHISSLPGDAF